FAPLLTFWAKIATTHDARDNEKSSIAGDVISESLPQIVKLYLDSMVQVTSRVVMGDSAADNPLEDTDGLVENITLLTNIVRSSYATCAPVIVNLFREMAGEYQSLLSSGQINEEGLMTIESQLTWPTYALALCINGRQPYKTMAEDDVIDAEMFSIGMELDRLVQRRLSSPIAVPPCEALELAFLQLYYSFRASYIGEQGYKTTSIFTKLSEIAGITDSAAVLEITMQK
ncbi:Exportin 7, partial [Linderina pennispora]